MRLTKSSQALLRNLLLMNNHYGFVNKPDIEMFDELKKSGFVEIGSEYSKNSKYVEVSVRKNLPDECTEYVVMALLKGSE
jgi:hypothetical protein